MGKIVQLPSFTKDGEFSIFETTPGDTATIIFKIEGEVKEILDYIAKKDGRYGNTTTAVITNYIVEGLEKDLKYKFATPLAALRKAAGKNGENGIPANIKTKIASAQQRSNIAFYANDIAAKTISIEEATAQMQSANLELLGFIEQGYSLDDLQGSKNSNSYKGNQGDWIYEISQKTDENEVVMFNGKEITRKKKLETDAHYFQYLDNGIEVVAPNLFENAFYKSYNERDNYFNNELRKVELQGIIYKPDGSEIGKLVDECCPQEKISIIKNYISGDNVNVIGTHLVKLKKKNERKYRYICIDCFNKTDKSYKQFVFMVDRGSNRQATSKDFFQEFNKKK